MRFALVPILAALVLAGCFGDDGGATATPAPSTPTATEGAPTPTPTGATPTTPTNATPSPDAPTPDAPAEAPAPVEVVNETFDYSSGEAAGPEGKTVTFTVPEGYAILTLDLKVASKGSAGLPDLSVNTGTIEIVDPDGTVVVSELETQTVEVEAKPGEWRIVYEGTGTSTVTTTGTASA